MTDKFSILNTSTALEALRLWHGGVVERWPLANLRLNLQVAEEREIHSSLSETGPAARNRAILNRGLEKLREISPSANSLIRERFEKGRDVLEVANSLNIAESTVLYRQRQAVNQLTDILNELENEASENWQNKVLGRLKQSTYIELVGIEEPYSLLWDVLMAENRNFIAVLDGLGGLGKTALADWTTRQIIQTTRFNDVAWITAKQLYISAMGRLEVETDVPAMTIPILLDKLAEQFELAQNNITYLQRQREVRDYMRDQPNLVIIDNLETIADYKALLPTLREWQSPSKFLLTSRRRLLDQPDIFSISMKELSKEASFMLLRQVAEHSGFSELAEADDGTLEKIYRAVGGNPLALKLLAGQLRFSSLPQVLARFSEKDFSDEQDLFEYIYREYWETISDDEKEILLALTQAGESGFSFEQIASRVSVTGKILVQSLENLILLSLVDRTGTLLERCYRLHRLTELSIIRMLEDE
ncbi:MAG: NB-ARC domain-containing protein [Candidatus Promineifilaceae bacterium]